MSADIIPLPVTPQPKPTCFDCEHASLGPVTYCTKFREEILVESVAEDCEEFEAMPELPAPTREGHPYG